MDKQDSLSRYQTHFSLKADNKKRYSKLMPITKSYVKGMYRYLGAHNLSMEEREMVYQMLLTQGERSDAKKRYPEAAYTHNRREYCDRILEGATRKSPVEWIGLVCKHVCIAAIYFAILTLFLFFFGEGTILERLQSTISINLPAFSISYLIAFVLYLLLQRLLACAWMPSLILALFVPLVVAVYLIVFLPLSRFIQTATITTPLWPMWLLPMICLAVYFLSLRFLLRGPANVH